MKKPLKIEKKYSRNKALHFKEEAEQTLVLSTSQDHLYELNEVASSVWRLLSSPQTLSQILTKLEKTYQVNSAVLRSDILTLLDELCETGLVLTK